MDEIRSGHELPHHAAGVSGGDSGRKIAHDDTARPDDGVRPDRETRTHDDAAGKPRARTDRDLSGELRAGRP
jgi:hypothetical protein